MPAENTRLLVPVGLFVEEVVGGNSRIELVGDAVCERTGGGGGGPPPPVEEGL